MRQSRKYTSSLTVGSDSMLSAGRASNWPLRIRSKDTTADKSIGATGPGWSRSGGPPNGTTAIFVGLSQPAGMTISMPCAAIGAATASQTTNALTSPFVLIATDPAGRIVA